MRNRRAYDPDSGTAASHWLTVSFRKTATMNSKMPPDTHSSNPQIKMGKHFFRQFCFIFMALLILILPVNPLSATADMRSPAEILQSAKGQVSAGLVHSLFIHLDGRLFVLGDNSFGQLGTGLPEDHTEPVFVNLPEEGIAVSAGAYHSLVLGKSGSVYAFGRNAFGQLGTGTIENVATPERVENLPVASAVAAGAYHSMILGKDGSVWAFGSNTENQCGPALSESIQNEKGELVARRVIRPQKIIEAQAIAIAAGAAHSLVLMSDGRVLAFGDNRHGQLGDGTTTGRSEPRPVEGIGQASQIAAGSDHSLITTVDQTASGKQESLYAFGDNSLGQIGVGSTFAPGAAILTPTVVDWRKAAGKGSYRIQSVVAGYGNSLLVLTRQDQEEKDPRQTKILIWGSNAYGQLAGSASGSSAVPRVLKAVDQGQTGDLFLSVDQVAIGGGHILIFSSRGLLGAAGRNDNGQTGQTAAQSPAQFAGIRLPDLQEAADLEGVEGPVVDVGRIKAMIFGDRLSDESYVLALQVPWDTAYAFGPNSVRPPEDHRIAILIGSSIAILLIAGAVIWLTHKSKKRRQATPSDLMIRNISGAGALSLDSPDSEAGENEQPEEPGPIQPEEPEPLQPEEPES